MGGLAIQMRGLTKSYVSPAGETIPALADVSLNIPAGAAVAVTGPSGSGKSTLLHVVGAMDGVDSGSIRVGDADVTGLARKDQPAYRRTIGFVFQRFHLIPALSVLDNVAAPLLPYATSFDKWERAGELLEAVGLGDRASSLPARLSGGQQQRVAIARAIVNSPGLLLADEPTGNLDSHTGAEIIGLLLELRKGQGMTLVIATHDPTVASRCDRVIRLVDGRVVEDVSLESKVDRETVLRRIAGLGS